ncbi:histidine N-acetyltransferase-like [Haliotis rufescens]|uniref:histidine N-acetyltransferase-like n=1 Tax=Haliotis rufescens TaxID=6454 RepID=UPI00201EE4DA|nr:histidine N-acetyltransferase-like [Haliotis rufescens]
MSDYNIRRATVHDFDGVMDIGDVYMGIDYLRHRFHIFMDDRNIRSYVYIIGKEVGFCSIALIDDGLTFLIRASRVKNGFRGQGVYGRLLKHIYAEYKDVDSIKYDAMTTDNYNCEDKKSLENAYAVMCRKTILSYRFKVEDIDPPLNMTTFPKEVNSSTMTSLFEDEKTRDTLFPEGKIIIDWVPLRLVPSNIKYILAVDTFALQSMGDNSEVSLLSERLSERPLHLVNVECVEKISNPADSFAWIKTAGLKK